LKINWHVTDDFFSLEFDKAVNALSSAVLCGGMRRISSLINLRVGENFEGRQHGFRPPAETLAERAGAEGLMLPSAGMMTAASMKSFRYCRKSLGSIDVFCFLTSGLSNALAAGDPGDYNPSAMFTSADSSPAGTINIAAGFSCGLSPAAMTEAVMLITEAKSSVLFGHGVKSYVSGRTATGTGTDSVLVFSAADADSPGGCCEEFCGKHTVLGELLASAVIEALTDSIKGDAVFQKT